MPNCTPRLRQRAETARMITGILANGTQQTRQQMSAPSAESTAQDGPVAAVQELLSSLGERDGLAACVSEGLEVAAIVEPLGLPAEIIAASLDGKVKVWDLLSGMLVNKYSGHNSGVANLIDVVVLEVQICEVRQSR